MDGFSAGRDRACARPIGRQDAHLHKDRQSQSGRAGSPLHAVVGIEKPDHLLRIVVRCDSCDGAHGVMRPTLQFSDPS